MSKLKTNAYSIGDNLNFNKAGVITQETGAGTPSLRWEWIATFPGFQGHGTTEAEALSDLAMRMEYAADQVRGLCVTTPTPGRSLVVMLLVALAFAAGCGDDVQTRPDASPKYDACDPTISKDCTQPDAKPIPPDATYPLQSCESLGCTWSQYAPTCSHSLECTCNNQTCQGTTP